MNPAPYPIPKIPDKVFHDLPYWQSEFLAAAAEYYCQSNFLAVAGTQSAIQALPDILNADVSLPVLVPKVGYQEHAKQWRQHGHEIKLYESENSETLISNIQDELIINPQQHLVIITPNNPTAIYINKPQLLEWAGLLQKGAYLIVDEAFIDYTPADSLLAEKTLPLNIIVLRSFGKFFGLAGLRLGFVFSNSEIRRQLQEQTGIWQVNGPAQYIAIQAFRDENWQDHTRMLLKKNSEHTKKIVNPLITLVKVTDERETVFFRSYKMSLTEALQLYTSLASFGVLTRVVILNEEQAFLRVGSLDHLNEQLVTRLTTIINDIAFGFSNSV